MPAQITLVQEYTDAHLSLDSAHLQRVADTALQTLTSDDCELAVVCVDKAQSQALNAAHRGKDKPTNVLSFACDIPSEIVAQLPAVPLGDLIICVPIVVEESSAQGKKAQDHFDHLLVHGILHLLGYDHELGAEEATIMEQLEIDILARLGIKNPYLALDNDTDTAQ